MNCVICDCHLEDLEQEGGYNHPINGTAFTSHGHYGSTAFDPMDGTFLELNICDPCLIKAGKAGKVQMGFPQPAPPRGPTVMWPPKIIDSIMDRIADDPK